jgi:hypothetical protein
MLNLCRFHRTAKSKNIFILSGASILPSSLINQILKYDLKTYYEERLAERRSFFRRVSNENIMKWQSGLISTPLTKLTKDLEVVALKLFKSKI